MGDLVSLLSCKVQLLSVYCFDVEFEVKISSKIGHAILPTVCNFVLFQEELKKHSNEAETSQSSQNKQDSMSWKDDIFFKVQGAAKKGRVRCMGKFPKSKKSKVDLSENEELRNRVKTMEGLLANVMTLIQSRFFGEDVNEIIQVARQVYHNDSNFV